MSLEGDGIQDEYAVTALQIFEYCGADSSSSLRVDALMDKFAPFVKTNKSEYSYLKSLLDPDQNNPEITVPKLAESLNKYSESQKVKVDLEESFNLRNGQAPHDSDSGISTDGFQLIEELQCELREKSHLAHQLRSQLDFTDRQHEEAVSALTAERDSLRSHLNMLREENMILTHVRRDYEDVCERLCNSERALDDVKRQLECSKKKIRVMTQQVSTLESEKLTLSELLAKSKEECHRINDRYASRQSALLEQNERLRSEHADLSVRLQDHDEVMQTVLKEKILLEMELKEMLNKTNQTQLRMDRSIDISYTEDQMLTALDSLNADSRFCSEQVSTYSQTDLPCSSCVKRNGSHRLRKYLWDPLKCLFQAFAVICFVFALSALYGVSRRWQSPCTPLAPWSWLQPHDLMDLFFRIEYIADVPM
ncbi:uncharacterized protein LOC125048561 isoform X4 [Pieris napi]|uniref:uncharacterized protein LOC125048561 isoform X4 n=1 Tax=Pieris napi TaxID=78633 RepID=UPI001FB9F866|nr:uncharacterized protein LOC125048561 isoform X4 [Pieris napi]